MGTRPRQRRVRKLGCRRYRIVRVVRAAVTMLVFALGAPAVALAVVPDTFIDSGPPSITNSRSATVTFHSDDPAETFAEPGCSMCYK
jgi:hypothetical protein